MRKIFLLLALILTGCKNDIEVHFCPWEDCEEYILPELSNAEQSIYFMTYSFTHEGVSEILIEKFNSGLDVRGVMEKQRINNQDNKYGYLTEKGIKINFDNNKYLLHHKVFIIDNKTVITGSANPSDAGYHSNNENIVIIHRKDIASRYLEEFDKYG